MAALEQRFTLHVPSSTQNLAMIRDFVGNVGVQAGLADDDVAKLELAVDEACTNVIEHAHGGDRTKDVVVRAEFDEKSLRIEVVDTGHGFDPATLPEEPLPEMVAHRRSGGLGLRMMKTLMDEVSYEIVPGDRNRLRLVKRLSR
ncbi:MAG: anti-sigma regulatory factor [Vicinamibacteraceae bacterium]|nr:anti-sigma regulatory factor [Vicinamibacteraceae bacterium]